MPASDEPMEHSHRKDDQATARHHRPPATIRSTIA